MSKYELIGYCSYRDTETGVIGDNFVDILNEQDQKIKELEAKLAIAEKALELACDKISDMLTQNGGAWFYDFDSDTVIERNGFEDFYKRYSKEMLENE